MRRSLFDWHRIESAVKVGQVDRGFSILTQKIAGGLKGQTSVSHDLSRNLKTYFKKSLHESHSERLKLKFLRTMAFHPSLGNQHAQNTFNQMLGG